MKYPLVIERETALSTASSRQSQVAAARRAALRRRIGGIKPAETETALNFYSRRQILHRLLWKISCRTALIGMGTVGLLSFTTQLPTKVYISGPELPSESLFVQLDPEPVKLSDSELPDESTLSVQSMPEQSELSEPELPDESVVVQLNQETAELSEPELPDAAN